MKKDRTAGITYLKSGLKTICYNNKSIIRRSIECTKGLTTFDTVVCISYKFGFLLNLLSFSTFTLDKSQPI